MSALTVEKTLAELFTDPVFREKFLLNPVDALARRDLTEAEKADFITMDKAGLLMASQSFFHKRQWLKRMKIKVF